MQCSSPSNTIQILYLSKIRESNVVWWLSGPTRWQDLMPYNILYSTILEWQCSSFCMLDLCVPSRRPCNIQYMREVDTQAVTYHSKAWWAVAPCNKTIVKPIIRGCIALRYVVVHYIRVHIGIPQRGIALSVLYWLLWHYNYTACFLKIKYGTFVRWYHVEDACLWTAILDCTEMTYYSPRVRGSMFLQPPYSIAWGFTICVLLYSRLCCSVPYYGILYDIALCYRIPCNTPQYCTLSTPNLAHLLCQTII